MSADTSGFFGGSIPAVKFESPGDKVTGKVLSKELRQQTDFDSGKLLNWPDGRPKMQAILTLQVGQPTEDDDGIRNLYVRGYMQRALVDAVRAKKLRDVTEDMWVTVEYTGDDEPTKKGLNGAKLYKAEVRTTDEPPF